MDAKPRLDSLTGLRFAAALAVAFTHLPFLLADARTDPTVGRVLRDGFFGVTFFFVLSGFVLAYGYHDRLARPARRDVRRYYVARIARIWPVHLLALLVVALALPIGHRGNGPFAANVFLVHAWVPDLRYVLSYNVVSWTLSLEMFFYLAFPLMLLAAGRVPELRARWFVAAAAVCWLVPSAVVWWHTTNIRPWSQYLVISPLARIGEFAIGVALGLAFSRSGRGGSRGALGTGLELSAVGLFGVLLYHSDTVHILQRMNGYYTPAAALVVWVFAHQRGAVSRFFAGRVPTYLGEVSFAFFMLHEIVFFHLIPRFGPAWHPFAQAAVLLALALGLAIAVHHAFEMPARAAVIRWGDREPAATPRRGRLGRLRIRLRAGNVGRHG